MELNVLVMAGGMLGGGSSILPQEVGPNGEDGSTVDGQAITDVIVWMTGGMLGGGDFIEV